MPPVQPSEPAPVRHGAAQPGDASSVAQHLEHSLTAGEPADGDGAVMTDADRAELDAIVAAKEDDGEHLHDGGRQNGPGGSDDDEAAIEPLHRSAERPAAWAGRLPARERTRGGASDGHAGHAAAAGIRDKRLASVAGGRASAIGFASTRSLSPMPDPDGLSWPSIGTRARKDESPEDRQARVDRLTGAVKTILECIGEDPDREGLLKTPERYAKALLFLTKGYEENIQEVINGALFKEDHDEMVIVKGIEVFSLCEHHCVPFTGKISIGYLPNRRVLGLSKVARIAEMFARRLQLQERLTKQVAVALDQILKPRGVAVVMEASHLCMVMRGVQKPGSKTVTSCMLGAFRNDHRTREEFLSLIRD